MTDYKLQRRVAGAHNLRLDGIGDLLHRARDASVFDIGCNRGMVGYEFALNGAAVVHGCDIYAKGIETAREVFVDLRSVRSQFEVVDLTKGPQGLDVFGGRSYDIVLLLATYHKLRRVMPPGALTNLMIWVGRHTIKHFAWLGTSDERESEEDLQALDRDLGRESLKRIHTSYLSSLGPTAIWAR